MSRQENFSREERQRLVRAPENLTVNVTLCELK
jgi:hypothetical protein